MSADTSIPAFPNRGDNSPGCDSYDGMSLRDCFAGMALQALVSKSPYGEVDIEETAHEGMIARGAYGYADAMIAARERKETPQ